MSSRLRHELRCIFLRFRSSRNCNRWWKCSAGFSETPTRGDFVFCFLQIFEYGFPNAETKPNARNKKVLQEIRNCSALIERSRYLDSHFRISRKRIAIEYIRGKSSWQYVQQQYLPQRWRLCYRDFHNATQTQCAKLQTTTEMGIYFIFVSQLLYIARCTVHTAYNYISICTMIAPIFTKSDVQNSTATASAGTELHWKWEKCHFAAAKSILKYR